MKKIVALISALALCVSLTACSQPNNSANNIPEDFSGLEYVRWGEPDRAVYFHLDELEESCEIAVVGTFVEDSVQEERYSYNEYFEKDVLSWIGSFNNIEILQVIKGDVSVGDTIKVGQGYGVVDNRLISMSDLTPMVKGDTWVFFLSTADDCGYYWCEGDSDGRYPLSSKQNRKIAVSETPELGVYDKTLFNDDIFNELVEKYGI